MSFNLLSLTNLLFILVLMSCLSCKSTEKSSKKPSAQKEEGFIGGAEATDPETYRAIVNGTARFHAMYCGEYVQRVKRAKENEEGYTYDTWLVNDGQDSIMIYILPIGNPDKEGYWTYGYQIMTNLPDNPLHQWISKLETIDRDSVKVSGYLVPEDLKFTHKELIEKNKHLFDEVDFSTFGEVINVEYYLRQNTLHYTCASEMSRHPKSPDYYNSVISISPEEFSIINYFYEDSLGQNRTKEQAARFFKKRMVR